MDELETAQDRDATRHPGMFKPGVSGNPSGRPKSDATIRELARAHTETAIQTLVEIVQNKKAAPSARVHAASALLDRGWGKPAQYIENTNINITLQEALDQMADRIDRKHPRLIREYVDVIPERQSTSTIKRSALESTLEEVW